MISVEQYHRTCICKMSQSIMFVTYIPIIVVVCLNHCQ